MFSFELLNVCVHLSVLCSGCFFGEQDTNVLCGKKLTQQDKYGIILYAVITKSICCELRKYVCESQPNTKTQP